MIDINELLIYLVTGGIVGFLAGLLGIGGGLIIVPILTMVFAHYLVGVEDIVHLAIGTSLATILVTSFASVRAHHKHGAVNWDIVKILTVGVFTGGFLGGWSSQFFDSATLGKIFAIFELSIALYMLANIKPSPHRELPGPVGNTVAGFMIGALASLVGIGGGTLVTPYLIWNNIKPHNAIAIAAACSLPVAAAGTFGFLLAGMHAQDLPPGAWGYIYLPAFFGIVVMSYFTAPLGAKLAHKLPANQLKRLLGLLLIILAIKMFFFPK